MAWSTPPTFTAGQTAGVASGLNTLSGDLALFGGYRTAWSPSYSGFTLGNGTVTATYRQVSQEVTFFFQLTFGSTTSFSSTFQFSLPVTAKYQNVVWYGTAIHQATSPNVGYPIAFENYNTTSAAGRVLPTTAGGQFLPLNATNPFTWASTDILTIEGRYEAA